MGPHSTSEQEPRARLSLRDARFADWQFSSEGHMLARPGGTLAGRLRTPYKYVLPAYCVVFMLGILLGAALSPATPDELQWLSERAARLEARATAGRAAGSSGLARPAHALLARDSDAAAEAGGGGAGQGWQAGGSGGASSEALVDGGARGDESGGPQYLEAAFEDNHLAEQRWEAQAEQASSSAQAHEET